MRFQRGEGIVLESNVFGMKVGKEDATDDLSSERARSKAHMSRHRGPQPPLALMGGVKHSMSVGSSDERKPSLILDAGQVAVSGS